MSSFIYHFSQNLRKEKKKKKRKRKASLALIFFSALAVRWLNQDEEKWEKKN